MILDDTIFGLSLKTMIIILMVLVVLLIIGLIYTIKQFFNISRKYYTLTSGKTASDLEGLIMARFKEQDKIKGVVKKYSRASPISPLATLFFDFKGLNLFSPKSI